MKTYLLWTVVFAYVTQDSYLECHPKVIHDNLIHNTDHFYYCHICLRVVAKRPFSGYTSIIQRCPFSFFKEGYHGWGMRVICAKLWMLTADCNHIGLPWNLGSIKNLQHSQVVCICSLKTLRTLVIITFAHCFNLFEQIIQIMGVCLQIECWAHTARREGNSSGKDSSHHISGPTFPCSMPNSFSSLLISLQFRISSSDSMSPDACPTISSRSAKVSRLLFLLSPGLSETEVALELLSQQLVNGLSSCLGCRRGKVSSGLACSDKSRNRSDLNSLSEMSWSSKETESGVPAAEKLRVMHTPRILFPSWSQHILNPLTQMVIALMIMDWVAQLTGCPENQVVWGPDGSAAQHSLWLEMLSVFVIFCFDRVEVGSVFLTLRLVLQAQSYGPFSCPLLFERLLCSSIFFEGLFPLLLNYRVFASFSAVHLY